MNLDFDREHIWHPYTSMREPLPVYPVNTASGVYIELEDGRRLVDGMSSWWAAIHGYNHPVLNRAVERQLEKMSHVMFGGFTHDPAIQLAERLVAMTPDSLEKVFFCDSGSVAVEVAVKMALQYHQAAGNHEKHRLLTVRSGYHGDTFAAMSVCDPVTGMHSLFSRVLSKQLFAEAPRCGFHEPCSEDCIGDFRKKLETHHREVAVVILEPVVQGAGGMRFYSPDYLRKVRELCDRYNVLLIFDEIATGFGRTGRMFAMEHAGVVPDVLCVGKALTGGYMTLAATLTTGEVASVISGAEPGVFMHGPTFMANPLACSVAVASIDMLVHGDWRKNVLEIEEGLSAGLEPCRSFDGVADVRVLGAVGVVEVEQPVDMAFVQKLFVERGVWVRPFGRLVYLMPPYIITGQQLGSLTDAVCGVVAQALSKGR